MRGSVALPLALSAALLVPAVRWCPIPWEQTSIECIARCSVAESGRCSENATPCERAPAPVDQEPGHAYLLGDGPGGLLIRSQLLPDISQLVAPLPPRTDLELSPRPPARPPEPEVRPPTFAWTSVRLARAPPAA